MRNDTQWPCTACRCAPGEPHTKRCTLAAAHEDADEILNGWLTEQDVGYLQGMHISV